MPQVTTRFTVSRNSLQSWLFAASLLFAVVAAPSAVAQSAGTAAPTPPAAGPAKPASAAGKAATTQGKAPAAKPPTPPASAAAKSELVDINRATLAQLKSIPGIGDVHAKKIIAGRPFANKAQLVSRNIVKPELYDLIQARIIAKQ